MKKIVFILGSLMTTMAFSQQKTDQFNTWWNLMQIMYLVKK